MPKYVPIDGERVSQQWAWLLRDLRADGVEFNVNEGHRTLARQTELFRHPPIVGGRPVLVAFPSPFAPHIRTGRADHAIDVTNSDAVIAAAKRRGVTLTRTVMVPGHLEPWHLEADARQLKAYADKARRAANQARKAKERKRRALERRPAASRSLSDAGVELIARFEGFVPYAYNDPVGLATVGYGHLIGHRPVNRDDVERYGTKARPKLSKTEGLALLRRDARTAEDAVRSAVRVPLRQQEYDALVSFVFNVGGGAFASSTLLRHLNAGKYLVAANQLMRWNKAGGRVLLGLSRRRRAERGLFRSRKRSA